MYATRIALVVTALALVAACDAKKTAPAATNSSAKQTAEKPAVAAPTLTPPTTPIKVGQPLLVAWTGPNGANDYVDLVSSGRAKQVGDEISYAKTSAGNPAKLTAPAEPGTYDVRYVEDHGDRTVIAHVSITVVK